MRVNLLATDNLRALCYAQGLLELSDQIDLSVSTIAPSAKSLHVDTVRRFASRRRAEYATCPFTKMTWKLNTSLGEICTGNEIPIERLGCDSLETKALVQHFEQEDFDVVIYAGPAGEMIPRQLIARATTRFLHAHLGRLPEYRGSTTAHYMALSEGKVTTSAFLMSDAIDAGRPIFSQTFAVPRLTYPWFDLISDPALRFLAIKEALAARERWPEFNESRLLPADDYAGNTDPLFVMHPVLRHLAYDSD